MNETRRDETIAVLAGGIDLTVRLIDGTSRSVKVLKLPARRMGDLLSAWGNEPEEVALYLGKDAPLRDQLDDESFVAVVEEGRRLNAVPLEKYASRKLNALVLLKAVPGVAEAVQKSASLPSTST